VELAHCPGQEILGRLGFVRFAYPFLCLSIITKAEALGLSRILGGKIN